jgi:hypothetical protein
VDWLCFVRSGKAGIAYLGPEIGHEFNVEGLFALMPLYRKFRKRKRRLILREQVYIYSLVPS